jgi:hypothetical protein
MPIQQFFGYTVAALRKKSKDWLAWNHAYVSEWGDISIHELLFQ